MPIKSKRKYNSKKKRKYNSKKKRKILKGSSRKNNSLNLNSERGFTSYYGKRYTMPTDERWCIKSSYLTTSYKNRKLLKYWRLNRHELSKDNQDGFLLTNKTGWCKWYKKKCKESAQRTNGMRLRSYRENCCQMQDICKPSWSISCSELIEGFYANNQERFKDIVYKQEDIRASELIQQLNVDKKIIYNDNARNIENNGNDTWSDSRPILLNDWDLDFILLNIHSLEITKNNITNIINLSKLSNYINKKKEKIIEALTQKINHMNSTGAKNNRHTVNSNLSDAVAVSQKAEHTQLKEGLNSVPVEETGGNTLSPINANNDSDSSDSNDSNGGWGFDKKGPFKILNPYESGSELDV